MESLTQLLAQDENQGKGSDEDRIFFEKNTSRNYRIRIATDAEVKMQEIECPDTHFWWTAVRQEKPGVRIRHSFAASPPPSSVDIQEEHARRIFESISPRKFWQE
jgi:hypothetical protein